MFGPILVFDESLTLLALLCLNSTHIDVVTPPLNLEDLLAEVAWFWPHFTAVFMLAKLGLNSFELAVLTLHFDVRFGLVLFLVSFGDNLSALFAFVVDPGALNFVHAEFGVFNLTFAVFAE